MPNQALQPTVFASLRSAKTSAELGRYASTDREKHMQRTSSVWPLFLLCPSLCLAEPVYLDCTLSSATDQKKFSVKLDESSGKITHTRDNGSAFNADGFFAANSITYQDLDIVGGVKITFRYDIDRTDLTATEVFVAELANPEHAAKVPGKTTTMAGSCSVVKTTGRKI